MAGKEFVDGNYLERSEKSIVLVGIVVFLFSILVIRIFYIQIIQGEKNLKLSINNRVSLEVMKAERGTIYDRTGKRVIARNRPSYSLYITPRQVPKEPRLDLQLKALKCSSGEPLIDYSLVDGKILKKLLRKKSLGTLDFVYTEESLKNALQRITDESGTPLFEFNYLDSLFDTVHVDEWQIESVVNNNSLPFLKHKLLQIKDRTGEPLFDTTDLEKQLRVSRQNRSRSTIIAEDINLDFVSIIEEHYRELPGLLIKTEPRREYPYGEYLFHVLGYMRKLEKDQYEVLKDSGYLHDDQIGFSGIEKQYESLLRGKDGWRYIEKNVRGRRLGVIDDMPSEDPIPGKNIYLTIDAELQKRVANFMNDTIKGAVVAIDPNNGEVLALYSNPSFDPNIFSFSKADRGKGYAKAVFDTLQPLNNKAVRGRYPPGSTFKLVSGLAAIDSGYVEGDEIMPAICHGTFRFGNRNFDCWNQYGHGRVDLYKAIKTSCNVYFYQVGLKMGDDVINHYSELFNLKLPTGIDIPGERGGYLSGKDAHNIRYAKLMKKNPAWGWMKGLILNQVIGQAQEISPLQICQIPAGLGHEKKLFKPHLLMEVRDNKNVMEYQTFPEVIQEYNFDQHSIDVVKEGMYQVVNEKGGTGSLTRLASVPVGGKSGSAENDHGNKITHALFVAAAPLDKPDIAVAVVLENAGHGGSEAAPVVKVVMDYFFEETDKGKATVLKYKDWQKKGWRL